MMKSDFSSRVFLAALLAASTMLTGCSEPSRLSVNGEVSIDGVPVEHGYVQFTPLTGTSGPTSGADIKKGAYQVASVRGLVQGRYRVEIQSWKRSGKVSVDPVTGENFQGGNLVQLLPAKYNKESELTMDIESGNRTFDFHLKP
ncbi:hypothetical protein [Adhaeretor mobilis]|uniref:Carboxypeptidase regulatory-like domain-containing protein n=1 Tax=Adhaeretor mobilis TaxID=1930276 RepID=A0A517N1D7_9BACT|nr:hypothetical protein [Adhaeretor mobilis]QDT00950.1 hypothetical protein HG15A2_42920 [Adhaeretor mobilis]